MLEWVRLVLAFGLAPLMASIAYVVPVVAGVGLIYAYTGTIIFGVPVYLFFRKKKYNNLIFCILISVVISSVHSWIMTFLFFNFYAPSSDSLKIIAFYSYIVALLAVWGGIVGGLTFWLILRPDKEEARKLLRMASR